MNPICRFPVPLLSLVLMLFSSPVTTAQSVNSGFLVTPTGQATGDTCQSYVLALALAIKADSAFPISTAAELRKGELGIRRSIEAAANEHPNDPSVNHDDIRKGFERYTLGRYVARVSDIDLPSLTAEAGKRTGVTSAQYIPSAFLLGAVVKDVVISSATRIGSASYKNGHLFAILGTDGPPNSNQRLLVMNSGVKVKDQTRNACIPGIPDDPGPYTASLSWVPVSDIAFKAFGNKLKMWIVEKK